MVNGCCHWTMAELNMLMREAIYLLGVLAYA